MTTKFFSPRLAKRLVSRPQAAKPGAPCTAETAECTCPDFCERDHANE